MEKKIFTSKDKSYRKSKPKDLKIITEYNPIKAACTQSNISDFETEQSFPKNIPNNYFSSQTNPNQNQPQKNNNHHIKSFNPFILFNNYKWNKKEPTFINTNINGISSTNVNVNSSNDKNNLDYESLLTKKNKYINNLKRQLTSIKKEILGYEIGNYFTNSSKRRSSSNIKQKPIQINHKISYINNNNNSSSNCNSIKKSNNKTKIINNTHVGSGRISMSFSKNINKNKQIKEIDKDSKMSKQLSALITVSGGYDNFSHISMYNERKKTKEKPNLSMNLNNLNLSINLNGSCDEINKTTSIGTKQKLKYDSNPYKSCRGAKISNNFFNINISNINNISGNKTIMKNISNANTSNISYLNSSSNKYNSNNSNTKIKYQKNYQNKVDMKININNYIKYLNSKTKDKDKKVSAKNNILSLSSGYKTNEIITPIYNKRNYSEKNKVIINISNDNKNKVKNQEGPIKIRNSDELTKDTKTDDNESINTNFNTNSNTNTFSVSSSNNNTINNDLVKLEKKARDLMNKFFNYYELSNNNSSKKRNRSENKNNDKEIKQKLF